MYKAIAFSSIAWLLVECFITAFIEGQYIDIRPIGDYANHFIGAFTNGVVLGLLFKWILFKGSREKAD
jgi:hypothetical protein